MHRRGRGLDRLLGVALTNVPRGGDRRGLGRPDDIERERPLEGARHRYRTSWGRSARVTESVRGAWSRTMLSVTVSPIFLVTMSRTKSFQLSTRSRFTAVMMSPGCTPARAAGPEGSTWRTRTPCSTPRLYVRPDWGSTSPP